MIDFYLKGILKSILFNLKNKLKIFKREFLIVYIIKIKY